MTGPGEPQERGPQKPPGLCPPYRSLSAYQHHSIQERHRFPYMAGTVRPTPLKPYIQQLPPSERT